MKLFLLKIYYLLEILALIEAMKILANDIICDDGVANATILEVAYRLEELINE